MPRLFISPAEERMMSPQWTVYDRLWELWTVHVAPLFGRPHELVDGCWCHPERDQDSCNLVLHNVAQ